MCDTVRLGTKHVFAVAAVESPLDTSPLLSSDTIAQMLSVYSPNPLPSDSPANMSASSRSFAIKFLNIMDPLLPTNNLGRSVSKASFARIRKALKHGAQVLTDILLEVSDSGAVTLSVA